MTPRRLNPDSLSEKLSRMHELLDALDELGPMTPQRLREDEVHRAAGERWLTLVVDLAVSINLHVAAARIGHVRREYAQTFRQAAEVGLIDRELADQLVPSAATRNQLIHAYLDIDLDQLASAFALVGDQYREYARQVARFVSAQLDGPDD